MKKNADVPVAAAPAVPVVVVPELDHDKMMAERFGSTIGAEQRRERRIVAHLCHHLITRGFQIKGLYDGEE